MVKVVLKRPILEAEQYFPGMPINGIQVVNGLATIRMWDTMEIVEPGDWVLKHPGGQFTKCSDSIFKDMYEPV